MLKILMKTIAVVLLLLLFVGGLYFLVKRNEQPAEVFDTRTVTVDTCLLYTSPSPRDATLSRMPSSA